jgi:cell wall assembly regulator SMI1
MAKARSAKTVDSELFAAVVRGDSARVRELLSKGTNPNAVNACGDFAIMAAALQGNVEIFTLLEQAGADLNAKGRQSTSVLRSAAACIHGNEAVAIAMLKQIVPKVDLSEYGEALSQLLSRGREHSPEYLRELIRLGADPNYQNEEGETALLHAVWQNRPDLVKELLKAGAAPNVRAPETIREFSSFEDMPRKFRGQPIIELATGKRLPEIVKLLKAAGARGGAPARPAVEQSDDIHVSWKRIEDWIKGNAKGWKPLKKAATDKQIQKAEADLDISFPDDLKEFFRRHNGSDGFIPAAGCHYALMPLAEVVADAAMLAKLQAAGDFDSSKAKPDRGVRKAWWHKRWIPLASNGGGDYYCLDLDPAGGGTAGQLIGFKHDAGERSLMSSSLRRWLFEFANDLESGGLRYEKGELME